MSQKLLKLRGPIKKVSGKHQLLLVTYDKDDNQLIAETYNAEHFLKQSFHAFGNRVRQLEEQVRELEAEVKHQKEMMGLLELEVELPDG